MLTSATRAVVAVLAAIALTLTGTIPVAASPATATITGRIFVQHTWIESADLEFWLYDSGTGKFALARTAQTDSDGYYTVSGLAAGDYRIRIEARTTDLQPIWYSTMYPGDAVWQKDAATVHVEPGETKTINKTVVGGRGLSFARIEGPNRYGTNVAITQTQFPEADGPYSIPVLYIASGTNYPDALSAGPAASLQGGALLLVQPTGIPAETRAEIERLNPQKIIIAGSEAAISAAVEADLADYAPVTRLGGANRYETSRLIVEDAFDSAPFVFVATGQNYPDALAAGPAAARLASPVILVPGNAWTLDEETTQLIESLGPERAYILGSEVAVTGGIHNALFEMGLGITRFAGVNRYDTAYQLNALLFGRTEQIFVTTGSNFADALSGGPLAASLDSPIYLSPPTCGTMAAYNAVIEYDIILATYLGSQAAIGDVFFEGNCGW